MMTLLCSALLISLTLVSPSAMANAGAAERAGFVVVAKGQVTASSDEHGERRLKRRSAVYPGDVIATATGAKAQIKFMDGAIIALQENSELEINEFEFDTNSKDGKSFFKMIRGGFRAISGAIGKKDPDDYRVDTPLATIGIRGTHFEVQISARVVVAVWQGAVNVKNDFGELDIGADAPFKFAVVEPNEAPSGVLSAPEALGGSDERDDDEDEEEDEKEESDDEKEESDESDERNEDEGSDEGGDGEEGDESDDSEGANDEASDGDDRNEGEDDEAGDRDDDGSEPTNDDEEGSDTADNSDDDDAGQSESESDEVASDDSGDASESESSEDSDVAAGDDEADDSNESDVVSSEESRNDDDSGSEDAQNEASSDDEETVAASASGNDDDNDAGNDETVDPRGESDGESVARNDDDLGDNDGGDEASGQERQASNDGDSGDEPEAAVLASGGGSQEDTPNESSNDAGSVEASADAGGGQGGDSGGSSSDGTVVGTAASVGGAVSETTSAATAAATSSAGAVTTAAVGSSTPSGGDDLAGGGDFGDSFDFGGDLDVAIDTALDICSINPERDECRVIEQIVEEEAVDLQIVDGEIRVVAEDEVDPTPDDTSDGSDNTDTSTDAPTDPQDVRLTDAEREGQQRWALAVIGDERGLSNGEQTRFFFGGYAARSDQGDPIIVDYGEAPTSVNPLEDDIQFVLRRGASEFETILFDPRLGTVPDGMSVGVWRGDVNGWNLYTDATQNQAQPINSTLYWLTVTPPNEDFLRSLDATVDYDTVLFAFGEGSGGNLERMSYRMNVNFATGDITDGELSLELYPDLVVDRESSDSFLGERWDVRFFGQVIDGVPALAIDVGDINGAAANIEGELVSVFAGDRAEYLAGSVYLYDADVNGRYVSAVYGIGDEDLREGLIPNAASFDAIGFISVAAGDGLGLNPDNDARDFSVLGGRATQDTSRPLIAERDIGLFDADWSQAQLNYLIRSAGTPTSVIPGEDSDSRYASNLSDVRFGAWMGNVSDSVLIQASPTDLDSTFDIPAPVYWLTAVPATQTQFQSLTGRAIFDSTVFGAGSGAAGEIQHMNLFVEVDFSSYDVTNFEMQIANGRDGLQSSWQYWNFVDADARFYAGEIDGEATQPLIEFSNVRGTTCQGDPCSGSATSASGDMLAVLPQSDPNFIVGSYKFWEDGNEENNWVTGVFGTGREQRFTQQELDNLTGVGFAVVDGFVMGGLSSLRLQREGESQDAAILKGNAVYGQPGVGQTFSEITAIDFYDIGSYGTVMRGGNVSARTGDVEASAVFGSETVHWGYWENDSANPVQVQRNFNDAAVSEDLGAGIYWLVANPTDPAVVRNLTGAFTYTTENVLGRVNGIDIDTVGGATRLDVNFTDGSVNGALEYGIDGSTQWDIPLTGNIQDGRLNLIDNPVGTYNGGGGPETAMSAVEASFVGGNAEGVAGAFRSSATGFESQGVFILRR